LLSKIDRKGSLGKVESEDHEPREESQTAENIGGANISRSGAANVNIPYFCDQISKRDRAYEISGWYQ